MTPLRALLDRRERVVLMGVLNCTPDSFSDGGLFGDEAAAVRRAAALVAAGAAVIDVGAESTRPGSTPVSAREQIARLGGVVRAIAATGTLVSIDTTLPEVAEHALAEGAVIVNTVSLEPAAELGAVAARAGAALVLMHSRGAMSAMKGFSVYADEAYRDVVSEVGREWSEAAGRALAAGLPRESLVLDPGLGFAKNAKQSIALCARLDELCALGFPVLVGPSRKSFVARIAAPEGPLAPPDERLGGTIAAVLACAGKGAAIARVHDVAAVAQALAVDEAIHGGPRGLDRGRRHA
ncbi:MAG: dihydropteroate synthase [Byssovorax sp.]